MLVVGVFEELLIFFFRLKAVVGLYDYCKG